MRSARGLRGCLRAMSVPGTDGVRLRQVVIAARDLDAVAGELRARLGLGAPFHDPNVAHFGLRNAVMALGDTFVEVVSPVQEGTAAGRHLDRLGADGGYMLMFEVPDVTAARARAAAAGIREVFAIDLPDIVDVHLHPRDMGGAIVALDEPRPPGSWRWGGPEWEGKVPAHAPGRLTGATVAVADPERVAARWAGVLGVTAEGPRIGLGRRRDRIRGGRRRARAAPGRDRRRSARRGHDAGGVRFTVSVASATG